MASSLGPVRRQVAAFLAGGAFMPLWTAVMDATESVDDDANVSDADRDWFDELYDAVYMAQDDPVDRASAGSGIIGAAELRVQLRAMGFGESIAPPT